MSSNLFYTHEEDSNIMQKKDKIELSNWIDNLEFIHEELELLLEIEDKVVLSNNTYEVLSDLKKENKAKLDKLYRYKSAAHNTIECDTMECDAFFIDNHEALRKAYLDYLKKYRVVKTKTLSMILLKAN
tara:strand:+ start:3203 stop:3589 length:387 start_codon:yes stop_codon:yes gene_type:complete